MADCVSSEAWRDGNWVRVLDKIEATGFDQFGSLFGEVFLNGSEQEQFELNLPGMRQNNRESSPSKVVRRTATVIGVAQDGMVFHLGAFSRTDGLSQ